jgi:hypothetical protein
MIERLSRLALCICFGATLAACGGGAGTMVLQPQAQEETRPTFNAQAAFNNSITDTSTLAFQVEGTANGVPYRGEGSYEQSMLHTVSEFDAQGGALRKVTPVKMNLSVNGRQVQLETTAQDFYTRQDLRLLGRVGPAPNLEFTDVTSYNGLPAEARVGMTGTVYTAVRYSDAAKRNAIGTTVATYTVEPDSSADTALLVLRVADNRADGTAGATTTTVYRITHAGTARRLSETTADAASQTMLKATFL